MKHFNSIETWSSEGGTYLVRSPGLSFINQIDFTTSASSAFGNNLKLVGTKYCIYSGDVNQDGIIDGSDLSAVDNDAQNIVTGYIVTDINGDSIVDGSDLLITENNARNFISVRSPIAGESPVYMPDKSDKFDKSISQNNDFPEKFELKDNFPNPFNPMTKINYELPNASDVSLKIFDITGKEVASLVNEKQNAERYSVEFNASSAAGGLSSGTYFYKIVAGEFIQVKRMILVK